MKKPDFFQQPAPKVDVKQQEETVADFTFKLIFVADKPPPPRLAYQEVLMAAEAGSEYLS